MRADIERSALDLRDAKNHHKIANWFFSDIDHMIFRISYDKRQEPTKGTTNFEFYDDAIENIKMVEIANPDIKFVATLKSDYDDYESNSNLPNWIIDYDDNEWFEASKYTRLLADYLVLMKDNGVTIKHLAIAQEWDKYLTVNRHIETIIALNNTCAARGITQPKYICPATWSLSQGISFISTVEDNGYEDYFSAFSSHNLNNEDAKWDDFVDACTSAGKSAYNDESSSASGGRTSGEEPETLSSLLSGYTEKTVMYEGGLQGKIIFEVWSRGVSAETRTIYFTDGDDGRRMRSYYVMQKFANSSYGRQYIPATTNDLDDDIATMTFASDDEIAIWVINSGTSSYSSLDLGLSNTTVNGKVYQYSWTIDNEIQGDAELITETATNEYNVAIEAESLNLFVIQLTEVESTDEITVYDNEVDYGCIDLDEAGTSETFLFSVDEPSTDVTISISGTNADVFTIDGATTYSSESPIYAEPVSVIFTPTTDGEYSATITITSGTNTKEIILTGEAYESEVASIPFYEYFTNIEANSTLTTSDINSFADNKGWQVHNGYSSGGTRMNVTHEVGSEDMGYYLTPEIEFNGEPFELSFYARMRLNNKSTTLTTTENNAYRNFYAVIGNDTIYDHHGAGSSYFQNYNNWTCTYSYEGTARIKFFAYTQDAGDWVGTTDGLTFGANTNCVSVLTTSEPTVNIAYGEYMDLGEITQGEAGEASFTLKGWHLTDGLTFTQNSDNKATISTLSFDPDSNDEINEVISVTIDATDLDLDTYTETLTLNSDNSEIDERTIFLNYEITSSLTSDITTIEYEHTIYTQNNTVFIEADYITNIEVFNISGQKIKQLNNVSTASFSLTTGVFLIKIDTEIHKVVLIK